MVLCGDKGDVECLGKLLSEDIYGKSWKTAMREVIIESFNV